MFLHHQNRLGCICFIFPSSTSQTKLFLSINNIGGAPRSTKRTTKKQMVELCTGNVSKCKITNWKVRSKTELTGRSPLRGWRCALGCSEVEDVVDDLSFLAPFSYVCDSTYRLPGLLVRKVALKLQCLNFLALKVSVLVVVDHYWTHLVHFHWRIAQRYTGYIVSCAYSEALWHFWYLCTVKRG